MAVYGPDGKPLGTPLHETEFWKRLRQSLGMTPEQLARFDQASNHPYSCDCEICKEWWELCGPEE